LQTHGIAAVDVPIWREDGVSDVVVRAERSVAVLTVDSGLVGAGRGLGACSRCPRRILRSRSALAAGPVWIGRYLPLLC
jgi:hypothetical protein